MRREICVCTDTLAMYGEQQAQTNQHPHHDHNGSEDATPPVPASFLADGALGIVRVINAVVGAIGASLVRRLVWFGGRSDERHRSRYIASGTVYVIDYSGRRERHEIGQSRIVDQ